MPRELHFAQDPDADSILSGDDFAVLIGLTLDQQYPMEHAFRGPHKIAERMGRFDITEIADANPDEFIALCSTPPAIHRFPKSMAARVQEIARIIIDTYDGDTSRIWTDGDPDAAQVHKRLTDLPGWGDQKARIFLAILGKRYGIELDGWHRAAGDYAEKNSRRSIADVTDATTLTEVRDFKKAQKQAAKKAADKSTTTKATTAKA